MARETLYQQILKDGKVTLYKEASGRHFIRHVSETRHHADHYSYFTRDAAGIASDSKPLDELAGREIVDRFLSVGSTQAFYLDEDTAAATRKLDPKEVRHKETRQEKSYTAIGDKLNHHWPVFQKLRETGYGSIIRATMTLHQVCSSNCQFCSTILRNRSDSISLEDAKRFVTALLDDQAAYNREHFPDYNARYKALTGSDIKLRGLILSGGGQPNLWPHFEAFVDWLKDQDLELGLITNGFPKNVSDDIYRHFTWVRLSVTPAEASPFYPNGRFEDQYIPDVLINNPGVTTGLSYVFGPWATDDMLARLDAAAVRLGMDYCRLLTDCNLSRQAQLEAHKLLSETLFKLGLVDDSGQPLSRIFHQLKYHGDWAERDQTWPDGQCMLQSYNVFWDTTGHDVAGDSYCYPCDSVTVLAEEASEGDVSASERRFNPEKWGTVMAGHVTDLYTKPLHPFFDPRDICSSCLFTRNNRHAGWLKENAGLGDTDIPLPSLDHVNFP